MYRIINYFTFFDKNQLLTDMICISQRCLHEWRPHNGEPVSSLFFCDNHLAQEENISSWRFLVTGTRYNSELKVWCSVSWTCLQTLR